MNEQIENTVPQVILFVRGGIADVLFKPKSIAVTIIDYDVDGEVTLIIRWTAIPTANAAAPVSTRRPNRSCTIRGGQAFRERSQIMAASPTSSPS